MSTSKQFDFEVVEPSTTGKEIFSDSSKKDEIVKDLDDKVTSLIESLNDVVKESPTQITNVTEKLSSLSTDVKTIGTKLEKLDKRQTLEWAIENAHLGSFSFWEGLFKRNSKEVVEMCLLHLKTQGTFHINNNCFGEGSSEQSKRFDFQENVYLSCCFMAPRH